MAAAAAAEAAPADRRTPSGPFSQRAPRRQPACPIAPIVDLRQEQPWLGRLPGRLGTAALWLGSLSLLGPLKLAGLLAISGCVLPSALVLDSLRRQRAEAPQRLKPALVTASLPLQLARAEVAEQFCLPESVLFQARHARSCTVVYDNQGRLAELRLTDPRAGVSPSASGWPSSLAAGTVAS